MRVTMHPCDRCSLPTDASAYREASSKREAIAIAKREGMAFWCYWGRKEALRMHEKRDPYPDFVVDENGKAENA